MRSETRRWVCLLALLCVVAGSSLAAGEVTATPGASPAAEQHPISRLQAETTVQTDFPNGMTVASTLAWNETKEIARIELLYSTSGSNTASIAYSQIRNEAGPLQTRIETLVNLQSHYLPAGIELSLWWRLIGTGGTTIAESDPVRALWMDDSQSWSERSTDQVILHSYALSPEFAEETLSTLQQTIDDLETRYDLRMPEPIRVWVYETYSDFQAAMPPNSRESIAALAFPGFHTIAAIVPDGDEAELLRVLPHEVSHQVLFQAAGNPFSQIPVWFDEGMATHVQTGGTDGYLEMVVRAYDQGALFRLDSLNAGFPFSPAQATLAYATSWSAVAFIEERWGDDGIAALVDAFATGMPYADAIPKALGVSADQLNNDWTAWVADQ